MPKRPIILIDVMETLVTEPFFTTMPAFFGMSFDELLATKHPTSWVEFEKGRITEAEYVERFFRDRRPVDRDALRQCLRRSYCWLDGMEELLGELKSAGYEIHALSNYSSWYELIDESLKLSRYLRWTFVSCLTGVRKPDRQAFLGAAATLDVDPAECLFIDDRHENVDAARDVGMHAILKLDSTQLRNELVAQNALDA